MKKLIMLVMVLVLLMSGCAEFPLPGVQRQEVLQTTQNNLNSCLGKLTKDQLIMRATPMERISVSNGEVWVYLYKRSERVDADPLGFFGKMGQSASYDKEFVFSVRLHFGNNGILDDWSFNGHYNAFDHPFKTLWCQ